MSYTIFTLILSGITALSTVAAFITCYITYRTTRPNISIKIDDSLHNGVAGQCVFCNFPNNYENGSICILKANFINKSPITGTITDIYLSYGNKNYLVKSLFSQDNSSSELSVGIFDPNNCELMDELKDIKQPIMLAPFFSFTGFLQIPNFIYIPEFTSIQAIFHYSVVGKRKKFKQKITLYKKSSV